MGSSRVDDCFVGCLLSEQTDDHLDGGAFPLVRPRLQKGGIALVGAEAVDGISHLCVEEDEATCGSVLFGRVSLTSGKRGDTASIH